MGEEEIYEAVEQRFGVGLLGCFLFVLVNTLLSEKLNGKLPKFVSTWCTVEM